jgi:hypothetical protein
MEWGSPWSRRQTVSPAVGNRVRTLGHLTPIRFRFDFGSFRYQSPALPPVSLMTLMCYGRLSPSGDVMSGNDIQE